MYDMSSSFRISDEPRLEKFTFDLVDFDRASAHKYCNKSNFFLALADKMTNLKTLTENSFNVHYFSSVKINVYLT